MEMFVVNQEIHKCTNSPRNIVEQKNLITQSFSNGNECLEQSRTTPIGFVQVEGRIFDPLEISHL